MKRKEGNLEVEFPFLLVYCYYTLCSKSLPRDWVTAVRRVWVAGVEGPHLVSGCLLTRVAGSPQTALSPHSWELGLSAYRWFPFDCSACLRWGAGVLCLSFLTTAQQGVMQTERVLLCFVIQVRESCHVERAECVQPLWNSSSVLLPCFPFMRLLIATLNFLLLPFTSPKTPLKSVNYKQGN